MTLLTSRQAGLLRNAEGCVADLRPACGPDVDLSGGLDDLRCIETGGTLGHNRLRGGDTSSTGLSSLKISLAGLKLDEGGVQAGVILRGDVFDCCELLDLVAERSNLVTEFVHCGTTFHRLCKALAALR